MEKIRQFVESQNYSLYLKLFSSLILYRDRRLLDFGIKFYGQFIKNKFALKTFVNDRMIYLIHELYTLMKYMHKKKFL